LLCLIPRVVSDLHHKGIDDPQAHLKDLYRLLRENKEAKKVVKRQQHFFRDYCLHDKNTLKGLLSMPMESGGEIMPSNLTAVILEVFRANIIDSRNKDQELGSREEGLHTHVQENKFENTLLQTKIVPFDELKLALSTESHARSRNGALRSKQSLVVCASLVDKVQNLAGIARTCEIFAVEQLVIPDVNLTKLESFQGIAVTADQWLDIAEVKETALLPWLRQKRAEGYRIAGLEQTSSSHVLGDTPLPEKCILLLGKEKEGIPVELLKEVTLSIEIPQFGVIRSLNVHVSAAIAIWELTKSNVAAGQLHM
jgi:tRNA guanosine-2'-O-methyltransferase